MGALELLIHGVSVSVESDAAPVLEELERDFAYFVHPAPARPALAFELRLGAPGPDGGTLLFRGPGFSVRSRDGLRLIRYEDGAAASYDYAARRGRIEAPGLDRLRELAYLAILSRAGEELDRQGLHRLHALGFEWRGEAGLLLLPSGGGKSTLALELLLSTGAGLLSDDCPLVGADGLARAFPLRLGFREGADLSVVPAELRRPFRRLRYGPKVLVDLPFFRDRIRAEAPVRWLFLGRSGAGAPRIEPASPAATASALARDLVVGCGVAQMAEYMVRPSLPGLASLAAIAAKRARTAGEILRRASCWELTLGSAPAQAAAALSRFLELADKRDDLARDAALSDRERLVAGIIGHEQ